MDIQVARGSAFALWSLSKSRRNKAIIHEANSTELLAKLARINHPSVLIPVIGTLQECASNKTYCIAMQSDSLIEDFVHHLETSNRQLKMLCALAIFHLCEEEQARVAVR